MTDRKYKKLFALIPPLAVAAAIFCFSSQPASASTQLSDRVSKGILQVMELTGVTEKADAASVGRWCEMISTPVRKTAHVTEFTILYLSLLPALRCWKPRLCRKSESGHISKRSPFLQGDRLSEYGRWALTALFLTFLYACSDEIHQLFVPGRSGQFTDVLIDCAGGAVISLILVLRCWRSKKKRDRSFPVPQE